MKVYRIANKKFAADLYGEGAKINGGRWNFKGSAMLYTATNVALAALEVAVNMQYINIPIDYQLVVIEIPNGIQKLSTELNLDLNWSKNILITQNYGSFWLESKKSTLLEVPSALVPIDKNILINPLHPDFSQLKIIDIQDFNFDNRLIK